MIKLARYCKERGQNHVLQMTANKALEIWQNDSTHTQNDNIHTHKMTAMNNSHKKVSSHPNSTEIAHFAMPAHFDINQHISPVIRSNSLRITSWIHTTRISCAHLSTYNVMSEMKTLLASMLQSNFIKRSIPLAETPPPRRESLNDHIWTIDQVGRSFLSIYSAVCRHHAPKTSPLSTQTNS